MQAIKVVLKWMKGRPRQTRAPACPRCRGRGRYKVTQLPCGPGETHDVEFLCRCCGGTGVMPRKVLSAGNALEIARAVQSYGRRFRLN